MGGETSRTEVHHHYHENPETVKKLEEMTRQYQAVVEQLEQLKNPKLIEQNERNLFLSFMNSLDTWDMYNKLPKQGGVRYVAIIGENSAGKSAMFNQILGTNEEEGVDDTTQSIKKVMVDEHRGLIYWDSPGLNEHVGITNADTLKAFYEVDIMFIATAVTFKNCKRCIEVMNHINPPQLYLVRNQCDKFESEAKFEQARQKDMGLLQEWGIKREVLYVSAKEHEGYRDNARFKQIMLGQGH